MDLIPKIIILIFSYIVYRLHIAGSMQIVKCQQGKSATLPFQFSYVSGPEDLHVSCMKMNSLEDTDPTVICTWHKGAVAYPNDQYRDRVEIRTDLPSGKLELILKNVAISDEGVYKCQAANKKDYGDQQVTLYIELSVTATEIMAAEGESVTFQPDFSGPRTEVTWKIGEDKLVEVDDQGPYFYRLADRASASFDSGSLTIRELMESDSGYYSVNILTEGKYHETKFTLKVSPSKPKVHYNVTDGAITMYCESTSTGVTYEWRDSSGDLLSTEAVYTAPPETLRINDTVTCIVRNKVTECNSSVTIEDYTLKVAPTSEKTLRGTDEEPRNVKTEMESDGVIHTMHVMFIVGLSIMAVTVFATLLFLYYLDEGSQKERVIIYVVAPLIFLAVAAIPALLLYNNQTEDTESTDKIMVLNAMVMSVVLTLALFLIGYLCLLPCCMNLVKLFQKMRQ